MCENCEYQDLLDKIESLQDSGDYEWADDTLSGIHDTVSKMEHCTEAQKTAVSNIENAGNRS
jgi:hypothetical protein